MRPQLKSYVLDLVKTYPGTVKELAERAEVDYFIIHRWKHKPDRLIDAVTIQKLYEHLTGKQLDY